MTVTLITGANKGLGYEAARELIERRHTVYLGARNVERGEAAASELGGTFVQLDVTDDSSVETALSFIAENEGHLDVLINNAGISTTSDVTGPVALAVFDTNVIGLIRVTQAALPLLEQSENPVVVNVSSALGSFWAVTNPERRQFHFPSVVYGSSKAAVSMLTVQGTRKGIFWNQVQCCRARIHCTPTSLRSVGPGSRSRSAQRSSCAWPRWARTALPAPSRRARANSPGDTEGGWSERSIGLAGVYRSASRTHPHDLSIRIDEEGHRL